MQARDVMTTVVVTVTADTPAGFRLSARVLEFPGGMPGDIGLFVVWGE